MEEVGLQCCPTLVAIVIVAATVAFLVGRSSQSTSAHTLLTKERRSVMKYKGKADPQAVTRAIESAIHAPNHWVNEPWRFRVLGKETAAKLSELNQGKKEVFDQVPGFMVVSVVPTVVEGADKWNMKSLEDHAACACAVQNFMVSLASEGVGSKWMTGAMGIPADKMLDLVGADAATEHYMGTIFFGMPAQPLASMKVPERKLGLGVLTNLA